MKEKMISPLYDYAFSEIFGNQKNIDITRNFLKTLIDIPEDEYDKLTVVSPKLRRVFKTEKSGVVDLKLSTKSGKIIHIELQVEKRTNTRNRMLFYASRLIGDQLKLGEDYNKLRQVISIVICDHNLLEEEDSYINIYELRNEENRSFTKLLRVIILELPKLPEIVDRTVWPWLKFFKCTEKEEFEMLALKYPELEKPVFCAKKMSLWEEWKDIRFHRNLQKIDERNLIEQIKIDGRAEGLAEGRAEGLEEGMAKEKLETAKNALAKGLSVEMIHDITGLDIETIRCLNS
ncbi:MAG: Rpn family recombination-promoting nuclease/putative transposase [Treponema sp.]|jgi:predicted transposase/invertase (TIGR01784 family)|nr:Rpn family recombination-promoting nuclease/putative transposase [Treponema sp.]